MLTSVPNRQTARLLSTSWCLLILTDTWYRHRHASGQHPIIVALRWPSHQGDQGQGHPLRSPLVKGAQSISAKSPAFPLDQFQTDPCRPGPTLLPFSPLSGCAYQLPLRVNLSSSGGTGLGKAGASSTYAARTERECCAQALNLMNYIIKFKNKFKTLLTPCNGLLLECTHSNGSLARRGNTLVRVVLHSQPKGDRRELARCVVGSPPPPPLHHAPPPAPGCGVKPLQTGHHGIHITEGRLCLPPRFYLNPAFFRS